MTFSVCFIERRKGKSPSIERVFRAVADELKKEGFSPRFVTVPYGNGPLGTFLNLILFRPPPADVFHVTGHVNYLGLTLPPNKTVLTIHDLTILDLRSGVRRWLIEKLFFTWPSRRLRFLTAISDTTRTRLAESAGISPEKIRVIQNPLFLNPTLKLEFNDEEPTVLQVGTAPNKNIERLIEAVSGLRCRLHIVGKVSAALHQRIHDLEINFVNDVSLDDEGVEEAYRNADIVTLCSTDEGFGLPIIEGQANGAVVVTSDRSPMKDVAGGGAILVDPESVDSIRRGISSVVTNRELREAIVEIGRRNIARFEKSSIASQYVGLYEEILQESEGTQSK
ncbi:MAG: glycosyltransferase family 1 protein [Pyrinomonadaceae bacterium]